MSSTTTTAGPIAAPPQPFDASELELLAEVMDGFLTLDASARGLSAAGLDAPTRAVIAGLVRRARAQAAAMVAAELPQDVQSAVDEAAEALAGRHGRAAVLPISPRAFVIVGLADDIEREWLTVRHFGDLVTTAKSTIPEMIAARDRTQPEVSA